MSQNVERFGTSFLTLVMLKRHICIEVLSFDIRNTALFDTHLVACCYVKAANEVSVQPMKHLCKFALLLRRVLRCARPTSNLIAFSVIA